MEAGEAGHERRGEGEGAEGGASARGRRALTSCASPKLRVVLAHVLVPLPLVLAAGCHLRGGRWPGRLHPVHGSEASLRSASGGSCGCTVPHTPYRLAGAHRASAALAQGSRKARARLEPCAQR